MPTWVKSPAPVLQRADIVGQLCEFGGQSCCDCPLPTGLWQAQGGNMACQLPGRGMRVKLGAVMVQVFEDAIRRKEGDSLAQPRGRPERSAAWRAALGRARGLPSMF